MPKTILAALAASLALAASSTALAQSTTTPSQSFAEIERRLEGDGFRVTEIERYRNSIEVKGWDREGHCTEMHLDPRSGEVLHRERDDSCGRRRGERFGEHHRGEHHGGDDDHHRGRGRR
jgi:Peptidase propeptide and YPEB domain